MKHNTQTLSALLLALVLSLSLVLPVSAAESGETALDKAARATVGSAMTYGQATQASWAIWQDGKIVSTVWLRQEDGTPLRGEIAVDGEIILTADFTSFAFCDTIESTEENGAA